MLESLFNKVEGLQFLRTPISKTSAKDWLVHNMSLKTWKLDQGATDLFILEFENKESICNVMSEIYKNRDAKKKASFKRLPELSEISGN